MFDGYFTMKTILNVLLSAALLQWGGVCYAGLLLLNNGDRISGELIIISDGQLHWQSELMGEMVVPQVNVSGVDARDLFEVELDARRQLNECQLQLRADQHQLLNCQQGIVELGSWKMVAKVSAHPLLQREQWINRGDVAIAARDSVGNTEQQGLAVDLNAEVRRGDKRNTLAANYQTQTDRNVKTVDKRKLDYQYDVFISDKWFVNGIFGWASDYFQDLNRRTLLGGGLGYQFYDTELIRLSVDGGIAYVAEQYSMDDNRDALAARASTDFSAKIGSLGLVFFHRNTFLQVFDQTADWRLQSETGLRLPIIGSLSAQAKLVFDYANIPAEDAHALDRTWLFGVNYNW